MNNWTENILKTKPSENEEERKVVYENCKITSVISLSPFKCEIFTEDNKGDKDSRVIDREAEFFDEYLNKEISLELCKKANSDEDIYFITKCSSKRNELLEETILANANTKSLKERTLLKIDFKLLSEEQKDHLYNCLNGIYSPNDCFKNAEVGELKLKFLMCKNHYDPRVSRGIINKLDAYESELGKEEKNVIRMALEPLINSTSWIPRTYEKTPSEFATTLNSIMVGQASVKNKLTSIYTDSYYSRANNGIIIVKGTNSSNIVNAFAKAASFSIESYSVSGSDDSVRDELSGTSVLYKNANLGPFMRHLDSNPDVFVIEHLENLTSSTEATIVDLASERVYNNSLLEAPFYVNKGLFLFGVIPDTKTEIPEGIRDYATVIEEEDYSNGELIEIGYRIADDLKEAFKVSFNISSEAMEMATKYIHKNSLKDVEVNLRNIYVNNMLLNPDSPVNITEDNIDECFDLIKNKADYLNQYVEDWVSISNKRLITEDELPTSINDRLKELERLSRCSKSDSYKAYCLETSKRLVNCDYNKSINFDLDKVKATLDVAVYSNDELKNSFLDILYSFNKGRKNQVQPLLLQSNPGHGKTSVVKALAKAAGVKYIELHVNSNLSGNGLGSETTPGFLHKMTNKDYANTYAIVFVDELDKLSDTEYAALAPLFGTTESYYDKYYECEFPKNNMILIAAANDLSKIPCYLKNRCDLIKMANLSNNEKLIVAREYLIPRLNDDNRIIFSDEVLSYIINNYVLESGLRSLEKGLSNIIRRVIRSLGSNEIEKYELTIEDVEYCLGHSKIHLLNRTDAHAVNIPGVATVLAVAGNTGCSFNIVVSSNKHSNKVESVGLISKTVNNTIDDAVVIAEDLLDTKISSVRFRICDGGTKVDGPSAGPSILAALLSYKLGCPIPEGVAFTGELMPTMKIASVGGVEDKLQHAERMGLNKVYIPAENYSDLVAKNRVNKYDVEIIPVNNVNELVDYLWGSDVLKKMQAN